jgi:ubiquinone/menaquinone biosynthesis C-methylase UbiE
MDYFERIWAAVPEGSAPEQFELRLAFLLANTAPGERVLDLGCAEGEFTAALADHGARPIGVDVAAEPLRRGRQRFPHVQFARADPALPFGDGEFTLVWAGELLEHVQDGLTLLAEVSRVLRPGGRLLVTTPAHRLRRRLVLAFSARAFERHFEPRADHVRFFTPRSLRALLAAAAFVEIKVDSRRSTLFAVARRPD